jgi:general secretion pathway protein G
MENKQDKGFTLVELLIVIVILGILATVTVFAVRGITDRGQDNACAVDARTLSTSIEAFYAQEQRNPTQLSELTVGVGTNPEPILKDVPQNFTFVPEDGANVLAVDSGTVAVGAAQPLVNANGGTPTGPLPAVNDGTAAFVASGTNNPCAVS